MNAQDQIQERAKEIAVRTSHLLSPQAVDTLEDLIATALREQQRIQQTADAAAHREEVEQLTKERNEARQLNALYDRTRHEHRDFAKNAQAQRDEWIQENQRLVKLLKTLLTKDISQRARALINEALK